MHGNGRQVGRQYVVPQARVRELFSAEMAYGKLTMRQVRGTEKRTTTRSALQPFTEPDLRAQPWIDVKAASSLGK